MYPYECFNSWINWRVLNRRFPESTVIETYRLHEFAYFLRILEQLPAGALTELPVSDAAEQQKEACPPLSTMMTLDDSQLANLDKYYNSSNKEYRALVQILG